jgi:MFS transporter, PHS family, inorganic phosphate transporter
MADQLGRKRMYGVELMIIVVATCASALSGNLVSGFSVFTVLGIWRVFLGLGIGGDYPLSAIITSEFATTKHRGGMMAAVFAMQGFGILVAATVAIILLVIFKNAIQINQDNLDYVWRLCTLIRHSYLLFKIKSIIKIISYNQGVGFGAIPGCLAIYFRLTIPETPRYTLDIDNDIERAHNDVNIVTTGVKSKGDEGNLIQQGAKKASFKEFCRHFSRWKHLKVLLGTSISWFALDVAFYGINLNSSIIIEAIGFSGDMHYDPVWDVLFKNAVGNIIIALMGTVPGYW